MVYCHRCGQDNPGGAHFCNGCGSSLAEDHSFENSVRKFADDTAKLGKDLGEKAAELSKKLAKEAETFAEEVARRVAPKPVQCPKCNEKIYETDVFCWKCGNKRL